MVFVRTTTSKRLMVSLAPTSGPEDILKKNEGTSKRWKENKGVIAKEREKEESRLKWSGSPANPSVITHQV